VVFKGLFRQTTREKFSQSGGAKEPAHSICFRGIWKNYTQRGNRGRVLFAFNRGGGGKKKKISILPISGLKGGFHRIDKGLLASQKIRVGKRRCAPWGGEPWGGLPWPAKGEGQGKIGYRAVARREGGAQAKSIGLTLGGVRVGLGGVGQGGAGKAGVVLFDKNWGKTVRMAFVVPWGRNSNRRGQVEGEGKERENKGGGAGGGGQQFLPPKPRGGGGDGPTWLGGGGGEKNS